MQPARALDGMGIEIGSGEHADMARATLRWNWDKTWPVGENWTASAFWEAGLGNWQGHDSGGLNLTELGITPVFRLNSRHSTFYWEGAIGAHFMSRTRINANRNFGSRFNFGDHVGCGWRFGDQERYELGYRFQHLSNADTAMPNDSINFHQLRLGFNFH
jgi:hypothetical protein